jgi:hypothetical protein
MKGLEILDKLRNTIETAGEPVSTTFIFAMLNEMARVVEHCEDYKNETPETLMQAYLYIADEYMYQRHFLFAKQYFDKAIALSENCSDFPQKDGLIEWCQKQLTRIYNKEDFVDKHDPVEHTEKYLNILIELEAKIEAELKGSPYRMGFCFEYWNKKEEILKRDYGIEWESPAVLNPETRFD